MPQLSKIELASVVEQFTTNIEDRLINPHIKKTIEIEFVEILSQDLINAIIGLSLTDNTKPQLVGFYNNYFKQVWSYFAYIRFLTWHGRNVTQFGLVSINDDTTNLVSDEARATLINNTERDSQVYLTRLLNRLKTVNYTFDNINYTKVSPIIKPRNRFGIRAVK
jgi:hypothetical protein